jgi:hypothetical protein
MMGQDVMRLNRSSTGRISAEGGKRAAAEVRFSAAVHRPSGRLREFVRAQTDSVIA